MAYWGISANNNAQRKVLQAVANDKPYTFITGPAGCGKTLLPQSVGLHDVVEARKFNKFIYTRLQIQVGVDLGALPGDISEKNYPFLAPFLDNFELLSTKTTLEYLLSGDESKRKVFFDPIQTVRGRSLHHTFVLADEAQNIDVGTMAALGTRLGKRLDDPSKLSSKMVFVGNFAQTDVKRLRNPDNNGMYQLLKGLYDAEAYEYFDHINLTEVQRHPAVELVEKILRDYEMPEEFTELEERGNVI